MFYIRDAMFISVGMEGREDWDLKLSGHQECQDRKCNAREKLLITT